MDTRQPVAIQRLDYQPPAWLISHTRLIFELDPLKTRVSSELSIRRNSEGGGAEGEGLILDGVDLDLQSVSVDGRELGDEEYTLSDTHLRIDNLPDQCTISIVTLINPTANKALEGLYLSSGNFCTQCEAEGFRKITYYLDRPDVLSVFDVQIIADTQQCPVLLANGNQVKQAVLDDGRACVHWHDPHPKPSYLFALVAGDLVCIEDHFVTASGRSVLLQIYVQAHNINLCDFAMKSLIASMRWDEEVYGLEYDLDRFMIVAVDDFNMGAMENKGLNIFNSRYVLADEQTATDSDFLGVEAVIAHEYFHNWTGNRITCRDWFQLSLKEGLTVFRDQCFSSDQHSATVKRIEDVRLLRDHQFAEDAGPMAHPIRPDSYIEINNFYTLTVYEKGAEVIRMLHTLLGPVNWRRGMDLYVQRHDGTATTCDAFVDAMQAVSDVDLTQFRRWYSTAGTPELTITDGYDADTCRYWLRVKQHCPDTPGQSDKPPLHIPLVMGLLDDKGQELSLSIGRATDKGVLLDITDAEQTFYVDNVADKPVASLLRHFSAPVRMHHEVSDETLAFLMAKDTDAFNRWEAGQRLAQRVMLNHLNGHDGALDALTSAYGTILNDHTLDPAFKAEALTLPSLSTLADAVDVIDYQALAAAQDTVMAALARHHYEALKTLVCDGRTNDLALLDPLAMGQRKLANTALITLSYLECERWEALALKQYQQASNMTDRVTALAMLCHLDSESREQSLADFHRKAQSSRLVMDKWFAVQATARRPQIIEDIKALLEHPDFDAGNPNRLRSVVGNFSSNNPLGFHAVSGLGYQLVADRVIATDAFNPQVASRMVSPLGRWQRMNTAQQNMMKAQLERILSSGNLSPDVYEQVSKSLS